jgi:hypothetical protein
VLKKKTKTKEKKNKDQTKRKNFFFGNLKLSVPFAYCYSSSAFRMTDIDWIDCEWGGFYNDDLPEALCGEMSCPGNCWICVVAEAAVKKIFLPIYGPLKEDGEPLGFLLVMK